MAEESGNQQSFPVVAVGAAAGGLDAFKTLLRGLPPNPGMAFVLIQHPPTAHGTSAAWDLKDASPMPVVEALNGMILKPNRVYLIPPDKVMTILSGALRLSRSSTGTGPRHPIDEFCTALAKDRKDGSIGILLSGRGTDGVMGLKSIRDEGGITFAQEPKSALYAGMPESAIWAGAADFILSPRQIAGRLTRVDRNAAFPGKLMTGDHPGSAFETAQEEMLAVNEGILTTNEELSKVNEELTTATEELQALNDELKQRNAELWRLSSDLNNVLDSVDVPILLVDAGQCIRRFTPVAKTLLKLAETDVGRPFREIASRLDLHDWDALFATVTETLKTVEREMRYRDGRWYTMRVRPYLTHDHHVDGVLLALLDIDSVRRTLEQIRQVRNYAESIVETIRESLLVLDEKFVIQTANRTFYETFRLTVEETLRHSLFEIGGRQWNVSSLRDRLQEVLQQNRHFDGFVMDKDFPGAGFRRMLVNARPIHKQGDGPRLILLAIEDVTESKRVEQELHQSESTVRALLDCAAQGIVAVRRDGTILLANPAMEKMFGYEPGELAEGNFDALVPNEARFKHSAHQKFYFSSPRHRPMGQGLDLEACRKDGSRFPVEISLSHMKTAQGPVAVAFVTDISERKRAESELRENAAVLQAISDGTNTMIVLKDRDGKVIQANPAALETWGDASRQSARVLSAVDRHVLKTGEVEMVEETVETPQGTKTLLVNKSPRYDGQGSIAGLIEVAADISERKKSQAAAEQYRGELQALTARLIAAQEDQSKHIARELHDVVSQRLAVFAMDVSTIRQHLAKAPEKAAGELEHLGQAVKAMADEIHGISRQLHPSIIEELGLAAALREECLSFSSAHGIAVDFAASGVPHALPLDIALCLYRVAQETLRNISKHSRAAAVHCRLKGSKRDIGLVVEDVGDGFDLQKARRKKGLGLISMEERVRMVNGVFHIESQPGQGTRVEVRVPLRV